jgi:hypothetical protein
MLQESSFDEPDELLSAIQEILKGVDCETLDAVFQEWMIRLQKCIDRNDEYVEWHLSCNVQFLFLNGRSWNATLRWNTLSRYWQLFPSSGRRKIAKSNHRLVRGLRFNLDIYLVDCSSWVDVLIFVHLCTAALYPGFRHSSGLTPLPEFRPLDFHSILRV